MVSHEPSLHQDHIRSPRLRGKGMAVAGAHVRPRSLDERLEFAAANIDLALIVYSLLFGKRVAVAHCGGAEITSGA